MSSERQYFANAFESLGRVLRSRRPELIALLRAQHIEVEAPTHAQAAAKWQHATETTARELFPEQSLEVGLYRLGQLVMQEYEHTVVGKPLVALLKVLGPERVATRVSKSFRASNNYTEDRVTPITRNDFELWTNEVHVPWLHQGVIQAALTAIGAKNCTVDVTRRDADGTTYRVRWDPDPD